MRLPVDAERIRSFARELGRGAGEEITVYLTGGATAVLEGWRTATIDVDIRIEPDSDALLRRVVSLKDELDINVELASPPDFVPELSAWRDRSPFVVRAGAVTVRHFDLYSQALSKIERGFPRDLEDVAAMLERGLVDRERARALFAAAEPRLIRYPAIDVAALRRKIDAALGASA